MKKLSLLILSIFSIAALLSCEKSEMGPVANTSQPGAPDLTSPESGASYTMSEDQADDTLMTIEWTEPDFGFAAAPTYNVQMAEAGTEFESPMELASVQSTSLPVLVKDLNNMLLSENFAANNSHSLELRVMASISDSVTKAASEPVTISATPYLVEINYPEIYVPGGYQSSSGYTNDWSPADAPPLFSVNDDGTYEGYVYIANDNALFKFTDQRNWDLNWGDDGADGTLEENGANIEAATAGYYKLNVNLNDMTYTTLNTTWGLIGSATADGWNSDQDMTYNPQTKVWTITANLSAGEIKFRANNAWNLDYGDTNADGTLEAGGENIAVSEAGSYKVTLDLSDAPYTYSLDKQ